MAKTRYVIYEYVASDGTRKKARVTEDAFKAYEAQNGLGSLRVVGQEVEGEGNLPGEFKRDWDRGVRANANSIERIAYEKDGQSRNILRKDVDTEGKALEQQGWKRKYSPLGSLVKGATSGVANLIPFSGGLPGLAKFVNPAGGEFDAARVAENLENSQRENPVEFGIGETGAPALLPIPGGKLMQTGSKGLAALRMGAIGTAAGAVTASNKAPEGHRLEGFIEGAKSTAPFAFGTSFALAPFLRAPGAVKVEPKGSGASLLPPSSPELGTFSPSTWLNPGSLKDAAGKARVSSMRPTPTEARNLAASFGGVEQAGAAINAQKVPGWIPGVKRGVVGNALESIRQKYPWTKNVLGTGEIPLLPADADAPKAAAIFDAVKDPAGKAVRQLETQVPPVPFKPFLKDVAKGPLQYLERNNWEPTSPAPTFERVMGEVADTAMPLEQTGQRVSFQQQPTSIVGPNGQPFTKTVTVPGTPIHSRPVTSVPAPEFQDLAINQPRAAANVRNGYDSNVGPLDQHLGKAFADTSGIGAKKLEEHMAANLPPDQFGKYRDLKQLYRIGARGDESTNAYRAAVAAPRSLGSEVSAAAGGQIGATLYGPGGAIAGRGIGRMLGRQSWVNPSKAYGMTRFAEGLEGQGIDPFWQAAGLAGRGVQRVPASAIVAGSVATDAEDPTTNWLWAVANRLMQNKEK
jgi:hypothetical protein